MQVTLSLFYTGFYYCDSEGTFFVAQLSYICILQPSVEFSVEISFFLFSPNEVFWIMRCLSLYTHCSSPRQVPTQAGQPRVKEKRTKVISRFAKCICVLTTLNLEEVKKCITPYTFSKEAQFLYQPGFISSLIPD